MSEHQRDQIPPQTRRVVLERDNHECQLCGNLGERAGGETTLHLHHRRSPLEGGSNEPSNILTLCDECHHHHHSSRTDPDQVQTNLDEYDLSTTPADYKILDSIESVGPASTGEIADEACISCVHARRRLYALAAANVVARDVDGQWDLADRVEEPARGQLPDDPERAARFARDDVIRRMRDAGMSHAEIAEIVNLDERTIPVAANRARAFDPPVPPISGSEPDLSDIARRVASIERQLDESETST
ncbi:HNH endonuclease [Natronobacterium texcoconense]|uniref:HNH endonuclease n=1 Tax=Natronobacterium texcoconense TaxID=1095778 RepID=A0A1H1FZ00_NATTX|nr:HNH endonuclease [Natronobacterium texcoconense]